MQTLNKDKPQTICRKGWRFATIKSLNTFTATAFYDHWYIFFYWLKCWIHLGDITKQLELSRFQKTCLERVLYMVSVYQFNITSWERLSWLISKEMDPAIPTCCGFGIIIFLFVPVFLFYYFSLNYYFSNIRSDSWGKMLLVIWAVTGDLRGQCLMSHCLMIRKCACHQCFCFII